MEQFPTKWRAKDRKKVGFLSTNQTGDSGALKSLKDVPIQSGDYMYILVLYTCNPNDLYFWRQTPQNKAFSNQNMGRLESRYLYYFFGGRGHFISRNDLVDLMSIDGFEMNLL